MKKHLKSTVIIYLSFSIVAYSQATFKCGSAFTDSRDGQSYQTVQIGTQCWFAQNLNYGTFAPVTTPQISGTKFCQTLAGVNDPTCAMGGLYEWANLMQGALGCNGADSSQPACTTPVQGLCPSGWHIPSHYEWTLLEQTVGTPPEGSAIFPYDNTTLSWLGTLSPNDEGGNLKQTGTLNWLTPNTGATNASGFTALPGGYSLIGSFYYVGSYGFFWSSSEYSAGSAWVRSLGYNKAEVERYDNGETTGMSVRCVKDGSSTQSIPQHSNNLSFSIFPNPSSSLITVQLSQQFSLYSVQLINLLCQPVLTQNNISSPSFTIDISTLSKSVYIVQVRDLGSGAIGQQRVVVQ
jgi:uncharacterized protein (TIGR02145 family)